MDNITKFIVDILSTPAALIAIFTLLGLLLSKQTFDKVISGTIKSFVGFLILTAGAAVIVDSLGNFSTLFEQAFNIQGVVPNNEAITSIALVEYGTATSLIMIFGMIMNLIFARFTPMKYIFLTGHHTLFMACLIGVIMITSGLSLILTVILGSILLGFLMVLMPAIAQPFMKKITGKDEIAIGHFGTIAYFLSGWVGTLFKKDAHKSTEHLNIPKKLSFLRDTTVSLSITMILLFLIVGLFVGSNYIESELSDGNSWIVWSITQGALFAVGIYIVLAGVRMMLGEIVPAFRGISAKLIPGAKPALDCPVVFPFAPNAMMIGFMASFLTGFIIMIFLPWVGLVMIVPGLVGHFFVGGTAGVFGNSTGGVKGCISAGILTGFMLTILPALLLPVLGTLGFEATTFSDPDFAIVGILLSKILSVIPFI